jgi:hypothetical protein
MNGVNELKVERESLTVPIFVGVGLGGKSEAALSRVNFVETMVTVWFLSGAYLILLRYPLRLAPMCYAIDVGGHEDSYL